jgi:SAM-dependent methyltransferase
MARKKSKSTKGLPVGIGKRVAKSTGGFLSRAVAGAASGLSTRSKTKGFELPPEVRRTVIREAARVLKPGGRLILDSLQRGDEPAYDAMLERFPQFYHEPYYTAT